jgi:hypothetical protein
MTRLGPDPPSLLGESTAGIVMEGKARFIFPIIITGIVVCGERGRYIYKHRFQSDFVARCSGPLSPTAGRGGDGIS